MFFLISIKFYFSYQTVSLYKFNKFSSLIDLFNWLPAFLIFITFQKYLGNKQKREFFTKYLVAGLIPVLLSCILHDWFKIYGPKETLGGLIIWFNKPLGINDGISGLFSNQNYTGFWLSVNLPFLYFLIQRIKKFNYKKTILFIISILSINFLFQIRFFSKKTLLFSKTKLPNFDDEKIGVPFESTFRLKLVLLSSTLYKFKPAFPIPL